MTALASASSQHSDGSEFAMSDSSMLEFVRDLNGRGDNHNTVVDIAFDDSTPDPRIEERSSSPEIDLVPSYLLTPSSQLIPTASSSLFNYRSGGNFRKKLSSLGSTLFSKSPPSAIPTEFLSDPEKSGALSPTLSSKDDTSQVPTKRGFVFPGRGDVARKARKESSEETKPPPTTWLKLESSTDSRAPEIALTNSFPIGVTDPFLSADISELVLETQKEITQRHALQETSEAIPAAVPFTESAEPQDTPELTSPKKAESKSLFKNKKPSKPEKQDERRIAYETGVVQALTGIVPPEKAEKVEKVDSKEKHEKTANVDKPEGEKSPKGTSTGFEKMREAIKHVSPSTKNRDDKPLPVENPPAEKRSIDSPKQATSKAHTKKHRKRSSGPHALVTIDNKPLPITLPRGKPPLAKVSMPKSGHSREGSEEEKALVNSLSKPPTERKSLRKSSREIGLVRHAVLSDETPLDRDAELQFSPFVVSGLVEQSKSSSSTAHHRHHSYHHSKRPSVPKREGPKDGLGSERTKTGGSTLLPSWAKLPDTLRTGSHGLSPKQRLTRLFNGADSHKDSKSNTASEHGAFSPREADKAWEKKPTVQSLGEIFARPNKTATFDQGGPGSRSGDLFTTGRGGPSTGPNPNVGLGLGTGLGPPFGDNHRWRNKFKFGFSAAKEAKVTKPRVLPSERERKPRGILKSTSSSHAGGVLPVPNTVPAPTSSEGGPVVPAPRLPRKSSGTSQRKRPAPKKQ